MRYPMLKGALRRVFPVLLATSLLPLPAFAKVTLLSSIKPLTLIAAEVVGDAGKAETLLPVAASPHDYPLRVSDMRRLQEADLVLWVGKELEGFLYRPLGNKEANRQLSVFALEGLHWPAALDEAHDHEGHSHHGHDHHHHDGRDPHLWLDPRNAGLIAMALAERLAELVPGQADGYRARALEFQQQMERLDKVLMQQLAPVRSVGFAVYHEGYQHFVDRYQLSQTGYVTYSPEQRPGARHLHQLRQKLKGKAVCLFTEPYYDQRMARELGEELGLTIGVLDPIGGEAVNSYAALMQNMAGDFLSCLQSAHKNAD